MAKGFLIERDMVAKRIDTYVKSAISATEDFDGGNVMALTAGTDDVFTATVPVTGALTGLAMAYNPSVRYLKLNGKIIANNDISNDIRDFTNLATIPFDVFLPQIGDEIGLVQAGVDGATAPLKGQFLEASNGKKTLVVSATKTASTMSWRVDRIDTVQLFPNEFVPMYVCTCVAN